jgi:hypothetical protein
MNLRISPAVYSILLLTAGLVSCTDDDLIEDLAIDQAETLNPEVEDLPAEDQPAEPQDENLDPESEDSEKTTSDANDCEAGSIVFQEKGGVVLGEMESAAYSDQWILSTDTGGSEGDGYLVWTGNQHMGNPGTATLEYQISIETPGTYLFTWRTAVTTGNNGTEHNDSWLRFLDADDFYGQRDNSILYPSGSGKTPNPNGASAEGWFKVYRSGSLAFKWQAFTSDHDAHDIFVRFDNPGTYTMEVSARSSGHGIDRFALVREGQSVEDALSGSLSEIGCRN